MFWSQFGSKLSSLLAWCFPGRLQRISGLLFSWETFSPLGFCNVKFWFCPSEHGRVAAECWRFGERSRQTEPGGQGPEGRSGADGSRSEGRAEGGQGAGCWSGGGNHGNQEPSAGGAEGGADGVTGVFIAGGCRSDRGARQRQAEQRRRSGNTEIRQRHAGQPEYVLLPSWSGPVLMSCRTQYNPVLPNPVPSSTGSSRTQWNGWVLLGSTGIHCQVPSLHIRLLINISLCFKRSSKLLVFSLN